MITIITGEKDAGKTTFFAYWYNEVQRGYGFYTEKRYRGNVFHGYDLVFLPDKAVIPSFMVVQPQKVYESGQVTTEQLSTDSSVFSEISARMSGCFDNPDEPVWIDGIGMPELDGGGLDPLVRRILRKCGDVRLVIRKNLLQKLIHHYQIEKFNLVFV